MEETGDKCKSARFMAQSCQQLMTCNRGGRGGRGGRNERNPSKRGGRGGRNQNQQRGEKGRGEWRYALHLSSRYQNFPQKLLAIFMIDFEDITN